MKVAVIGLGYVGAVTSVCLANSGHEVLGVDVDSAKVALLRAGKSPIIEESIGELTEAVAKGTNLTCATAIDWRVGDCVLVMVCVGTPSAANGSQDLTAIKRVSEEIGLVLRDSLNAPVVVIRSTVPPGTTETIIQPIIERASGKLAENGFDLCFQPEFLREGASVKDFFNPPFTVVGGSEAARDKVFELFNGFPGEFLGTDIRSAELLKVACNSFHALKVTFANEIGRIGRAVGLDGRKVMELVCQDTQLNISPAYLRPGFAFGGSCLPKDLRALLYTAKQLDVELPMLRGILPSNDEHIERVAELVLSGPSRKVGLIGLSFKQGTDDLRESPLVSLAERLIGKGYELRIYDPAVSIAMLRGSNKVYIERTIPHIGTMLEKDLADVVTWGDTIVVGHKSDQITAELGRQRGRIRLLVDLVGIADEGFEDYRGVAW